MSSPTRSVTTTEKSQETYAAAKANENGQSQDLDVEKAMSNSLQKDNGLAPIPTHDPEYEVSFEGLHDPLNPRGFGKAKKWAIVLICSATSLCVTCTSSLYVMTYSQITKEFNVSNIVATLGLSLFVVGLGLSPMVLSPLSEVSLFKKINFPTLKSCIFRKHKTHSIA
jgi:hypothetical protein